MGPVLRSDLDAVLRDVQRDAVPVPHIRDEAWQPWPGSDSVSLVADDASVLGVWIDLSFPDADRLAQLADQVQEWVIEELARTGLATNWPACSAHPGTHPRTAVVIDGLAVWACPRGEGTAYPIGG